jgi:hypothetical protein
MPSTISGHADVGMIRSCLQLVIALILCLSFASKARDISGFVSGVIGYKVLPLRLAAPYAYTVVFAEALLAVAHLTGFLMILSTSLGLLLFITFVYGQCRAYSSRILISCHCFGDSDPVSKRTVIRVVLLLLAEICLCLDAWFSQSGLLPYFRPVMSGSFPLSCLLIVAIMWLFAVPELLILAREVFNGEE